jgi:hypothetical protein
VYQYKFIVDGEWKYAPELPAMRDEIGNVNNVLEVHPSILSSSWASSKRMSKSSSNYVSLSKFLVVKHARVPMVMDEGDRV